MCHASVASPTGLGSRSPMYSRHMTATLAGLMDDNLMANAGSCCSTRGASTVNTVQFYVTTTLCNDELLTYIAYYSFHHIQNSNDYTLTVCWNTANNMINNMFLASNHHLQQTIFDRIHSIQQQRLNTSLHT